LFLVAFSPRFFCICVYFVYDVILIIIITIIIIIIIIEIINQRVLSL